MDGQKYDEQFYLPCAGFFVFGLQDKGKKLSVRVNIEETVAEGMDQFLRLLMVGLFDAVKDILQWGIHISIVWKLNHDKRVTSLYTLKYDQYSGQYPTE